MTRWLARLAGERFDLEEIATWFPSGPVHGLEERNAFYLAGPALDALPNDERVYAIAARALDEFSAIVSLLTPGFRRPTIDAVAHVDGANTQYFKRLTGEGRGRSKVRGVLTVADKSGVGPTQAQRLLQAARSDKRFSVVLSLWADPNRTWTRLYNTLEELEKYLGRRVDKAQLTTGKQRDRFTRSANSAEVAGIDARHAAGKSVPPSNPMSLRYASSFVGSMIRATLDSLGTPNGPVLNGCNER